MKPSKTDPLALIEQGLLPVLRHAGSWRRGGRLQALVLPIRLDWLVAWLRLGRDAADAPDRIELWSFAERLPGVELIDACLGALHPPHDPIHARLREQWPVGLPGLHRLDFQLHRASGSDLRVRLVLGVGPVIGLLASVGVHFDAIAWADEGRSIAGQETPSPQAGWQRALTRRARPGAGLLLAQSQPADAQGLWAEGWESLEPLAGQAQRFLLGQRAHRSFSGHATPILGGRADSRASGEDFGARDRRVAIVGAGLAGCACAKALAERGWQVTIFEARSQPAPGAGQPCLADHPHLSPDDNLLARLTRHALAFSPDVRAARQAPLGRLQLAMNDAQHEAHRRSVARLGPAADRYARVVDAQQASDLAGLALHRPALWLPGCDRVDPLALGARWLANDASVVLMRGSPVAQLLERDGCWQLRDAAGQVLAVAPVVVLANAQQAPVLAGASSMRLQSLRAQSTRLRHPALTGLRCILGGDRYAAPLHGGDLLVGATLLADVDEQPSPLADARNLQQLLSMIGASDVSPTAVPMSGYPGWRASLPDRLPAIGPMPDEARTAAEWQNHRRNDRLPLPRRLGLYGAFGLGSRGLLWASLAAEVLAAMIDESPVPLQDDLLAAIDPARFLRRALRRDESPLG